MVAFGSLLVVVVLVTLLVVDGLVMISLDDVLVVSWRSLWTRGGLLVVSWWASNMMIAFTSVVRGMAQKL